MSKEHRQQTSDGNRFTRRTYLALTGAAGLAGCLGGGNGSGGNGSGGNGSNGGDSSGNGSGSSGSGGSGSNTFEIIHWWTAGGEKQAINALLDGFKKKYPDIKIKNNPAPGGAGSAQAAVVRNRVLNENPPSTFQIWPGKSLNTYTEPGILTDIGNSVWDQEMRDAYVKGPKQLAKPQGDFVAVPLNIHRLNNLFYNKNVVESAGVDPKSLSDPSALTNALAKIEKNTDATGMAQSTKTPWTTIQLWETVFLGQQGPEAISDVFEGNASRYKKGIKNALTTVKNYKQYFVSDAGSVAWDQANSSVINGDAAFLMMGDWAAGQYKSQENFEYGKDWDYVPYPGTKGTYTIVVDSFVMPKNNPSPDATKKWLSYCGSVEGQKLFNPVKGSIPPRTDVPNKPFGPFLTEQRKDYKTSKAQPATIAHGTGVTPEQKQAVTEAFASFTSNWKVDAAYKAINKAFK